MAGAAGSRLGPLHLALHPHGVPVDLQREIMDGPGLERQSELQQCAADAQVDEAGGDLAARGAADVGGDHALALCLSRSRNESRSAWSSSSTSTKSIPTWKPSPSSAGGSTCTTRPFRSTATCDRLMVMSQLESRARGAAISRLAPLSESAKTLNSANTVARPVALPSSRTLGWRRRSSSVIIGLRIVGAGGGDGQGRLYFARCPSVPRGPINKVKGSLTEGALPALLRAVYVGRKTGVLQFTRGQDVRSVRFRQGHILSAQSSVASEHLGEVLVRNELLTAADLERAGARKRATGKRLGETLQEMGLIEREHLEDALALHVREVLLNVFSWNRGEYQLEEPAGAAFHGEPTLKLSTGEMILETVRLLQNPGVVRAALGNTDRVLDLSTDPLLRFQKVTLSPTDGYVLSRVDGVMKARDIIEMIPLPQEEV